MPTWKIEPKDVPTNLDNDKELKRLISGLKIEYYDLLHKHAYADFKLGEEDEPEGYAKDEKWLEGVYVQAFKNYTRSKLKAFAGEVEEAIERSYDKATVNSERKLSSNISAEEMEKHITEALKAIKEKAGIE